MSNEIDTVDHHSKSPKRSNSDSSESNESDYIEEDQNNRYKVGVVASPVVKPLDPNALRKKSVEKDEIDTS